MEERLGLSRYYISRIENGHTIPTLETLARFARALEVPVFHLVYEEEGPYQPPIFPKSTRSNERLANLSKRDLRRLKQLAILFGKLRDRDRRLLVSLARKMANWMPRSLTGKRPEARDNARTQRPHPSSRVSFPRKRTVKTG
jgi:transcriptional regulator with XRE-family HTH domain